MSTVEESQDAKHGIAAVLDAGVSDISENQTIRFQRYIMVTLPVDGSVFWVRDLTASPTVIQGSLHNAMMRHQNEDESVTINRVVFTARQPVQDLDTVGPLALYIGQLVDTAGAPYGEQFSFSQQKSFYRQAGLYHYTGDAIYPAMRTQIVDNLGDARLTDVVVNNSLPFWLALSKFMPMYPSFLVEPNIQPPYAAVHIGPADTTAIQAIASQEPVFEMSGLEVVKPLNILSTSRSQLVRDRVKVTVWGLRNSDAQGWLDYAVEFMTNSRELGLVNAPVIRDEKRTQAEQNIVGMKKSIEFEVTYHQSRAYACALQLIKQVLVTYFPD